MKRMSDAEYKWKLFKMTWLVPNWGRARGPAFWIYKMMDWWRWNMTLRFSNSWLSETVEWFRDKLFRKLTPWLEHARDFMEVVINENGTKLLDCTSMGFRIRTRDEHQYYFSGKCSLFGKVKIWQSQYVDSTGEPQNIFVNALVGEEALHEEKKLIWEGRVLTKADKVASIEEIIRIPEFGWSYFFIHCLLYGLKKLGKHDVFVRERDCGDIYKKEIVDLVEERFGERKELYELTDEEEAKFDEFVLEKIR